MPKIKIPTKRERLLKRKFPKALREDSIMGNQSISHEEQKKIDDEASAYWIELQEKSDEEIDAIIEAQEKEKKERIKAQNPIPSREDVYKKVRPDGVLCPDGVWVKAAMALYIVKIYGDDWHEQKPSQVVSDFLAELITTPEIEVFTIGSFDGEKEAISRDWLRGRNARDDSMRGFIPYSDGFNSSKKDGRFLFVNKEHFENYLDDKPIDNMPSNDEEIQGVSAYIPAYLELMLKAVKSLNLSPDKRANMDDITGWLNENWPSDLEGKSDRMIKSMATLLRRPEDKKGGNTSWK